MTRVHARRLELLVLETRLSEHSPGRPMYVLGSPRPGRFTATVQPATWCNPGMVIGTLDVLGTVFELLVPADARGSAANHIEPEGGASLETRAVGYGDAVVVLDTRATPMGVGDGGLDAVATILANQRVAGLVFRSPTSGRFYGRPSPDKPAFVSVGDELAQGATICLLEVMKTFHRVTYGGTGLPERARVREVLVGDGADVTSGEALLALE